MTELEESIMSANLARRHIPIGNKEQRKMGETQDNATWLRMMREEFAGLKAWLAGPDGQHGGILHEIKDDLAGLNNGQRQIEEQISTLVNVQLRDKAELEAKIVVVKNDVDSVGTIARGAQRSIKDHVDEMGEIRKFKIEQFIAIVGVVVGVVGVVGGILLGRAG